MTRKVVLGFRIEPEIRDLIKEIAKRRDIDLADFMRELVKRELAELGYLSEEERRAFDLR